MIDALRKTVGDNADVIIVLMVIGMLVVLFAPIPPALLDMLLLMNFSFALLLLLLTFYMKRPVEFSTFPSLLLVVTLFRLALNVAATRLILTDGNPGMVITSVGSYVVGGNYVIGLIVFLILVVVQFVVVTAGAQRVSEVAARFTLDSMPGQQMSIDADLNMGLIDQEEAKKRRKALERETSFYGAMDGASKFVKGDAIAGIIILLINSIGGLIIGVMQLGMSWGQALQTYTLLTIGDGIVTQVPALVIAVATGIIVTRSGSDENLSTEVIRQVTAYPKALFIVAAALFGLMFFPGLPFVPVVILLFLVLGLAIFLYRSKHKLPSAEKNQTSSKSEASADLDLPPVDAVEVRLGINLTPFAASELSPIQERISMFRQQFANDAGLVLPRVRFRDDPRMTSNAYEIAIFGVATAQGEVLPDRTLAILPGADAKKNSRA